MGQLHQCGLGHKGAGCFLRGQGAGPDHHHHRRGVPPGHGPHPELPAALRRHSLGRGVHRYGLLPGALLVRGVELPQLCGGGAQEPLQVAFCPGLLGKNENILQ